MEFDPTANSVKEVKDSKASDVPLQNIHDLTFALYTGSEDHLCTIEDEKWLAGVLSGKNKVIANDKVEGKGHLMTSGDLSYFKKVLKDMESYKPQQKDAEKEKRDKKKKKSN